MAEKHLDISFTDRKEEEGYGLKGAILFEEDGRHYLRLHYKKENGDDLYIPKLSLPIDRIPIFEDRYETHETLFSKMKYEECYAIWEDIRLEAERGVMTVPDNNGNPVKIPSPCYYVLVRPKKKIEEALGYCIEIVEEDFIMEENKTTCGCKCEKKEYCIIFLIGEEEERHVVITARDVLEAMDTFAHIGRVLFALCSNPNSAHIPNPADVRIIRVFENEV